jgi:hypothetical protein
MKFTVKLIAEGLVDLFYKYFTLKSISLHGNFLNIQMDDGPARNIQINFPLYW